MLGKLLKYETKATARTFLPLYGALIVFAILNRIFLWANTNMTAINIFRVLFMVGYVILIIGIMVLTYIVMIQRFYKNLVKDEGYLMFTLPVKPWELITSKLIVSGMWLVVSSILIFISVFIMAGSAEVFSQMAEAFREFNIMLNEYFGSTGLFYFEFILMALIAVLSSVLMIFASISIGSLFKNKLLGAFGSYIVIYLIMQLIVSVLAVVFSFTNLSLYNNIVMDKGMIQLIIWGIVLLNAFFSTGYFAVSNYIFTKKLNLE